MLPGKLAPDQCRYSRPRLVPSRYIPGTSYPPLSAAIVAGEGGGGLLLLALELRGRGIVEAAVDPPGGSLPLRRSAASNRSS